MDHEKTFLEQKVEILRDRNDVCGCTIALYSLSLSIEKIDQVISVVLSKLAKKDRFSLVLVFYWLTLNMKVYDIIMYLNWILKTHIL